MAERYDEEDSEVTPEQKQKATEALIILALVVLAVVFILVVWEL